MTEDVRAVGPGFDGAEQSGHELLRRICQATVPMLQASGAAVSTISHGVSNGSVFSTDPTAARIDELQFELGEGPGLDAIASGGPVLISDLGQPAAQRRWPAFAPAAGECGAVALWSFPLVIGAIRLGLLAVYHVAPAHLSREQVSQASRLADAASFGLLDVEAGPRTTLVDGVAGRVEAERSGGDGAFHRAEVYQASGMISVQLDVNLDTALSRLRAFAFAAGRSVSDVARDVVARTIRLEADNV